MFLPRFEEYLRDNNLRKAECKCQKVQPGPDERQRLAKNKSLRPWRDWLEKKGGEEEKGEDARDDAEDQQPLLEGN